MQLHEDREWATTIRGHTFVVRSNGARIALHATLKRTGKTFEKFGDIACLRDRSFDHLLIHVKAMKMAARDVNCGCSAFVWFSESGAAKSYQKARKI